MISLESISGNIAKKWASKVPNKYPTVEDQIEVHAYGILACFQILIEGFILIVISSLFEILISTVIITLTFSSFRIIGGGGFHFELYAKCATISLIQFIGTALTIKYTYQYWSIANLWYLFILTILLTSYIIYRYVPRDTPNKPITEPSERNKFKKWSLYYLLIWTSIMTISLLLNLKIIILSSCFGLLLELFSISHLGYQLYSSIEKINLSKIHSDPHKL